MPLRNITLKNADITAEKGVSVTDAQNILFDNVRVENKSGEPIRTFRVKDSKLDVAR